VLAPESQGICLISASSVAAGGEFVLGVQRGEIPLPTGAALLDAQIDWRSKAAERALARGDKKAAATHRLTEGNQLYSRSKPYTGVLAGPVTRNVSRSSSTYCCSFFQFSSRRASTCDMKASRSDWAAADPNPLDSAHKRVSTPNPLVVLFTYFSTLNFSTFSTCLRGPLVSPAEFTLESSITHRSVPLSRSITHS
jgi:hypothetical protein